MINLLPKNEIRQLQAARTNTLLIRYNLFLIGSVVFLLLSIGFVYFYLNNAKATAEQTISENKAKVAGFDTVESQTKQFRSNLATAKQILDREVTYTKVILAIAKLLPAGTVLDNLSLDSATFGTETALTAKAKTYENALALKDSFQNSSLFSNVHFENITTTGDVAGTYPITVTLKVTIKKDAAK